MANTNFIFECWKYLFTSERDISALEDKIRIPARPCNIIYNNSKQILNNEVRVTPSIAVNLKSKV